LGEVGGTAQKFGEKTRIFWHGPSFGVGNYNRKKFGHDFGPI
jgi:hypothetical protein